MADGENKRVRWFERGVKSDTRNAANGAGTVSSTRRAATPGFECQLLFAVHREKYEKLLSLSHFD